MKNYLIVILLLFPINAFGYHIKGEIRDSKTNLPVQYASIYINGTTIGTTSNENGNFNLSFELNDCEISITHVCYHSKKIQFNQSTDLQLNVKLKPKALEFSKVTVDGKDKRSTNLDYFKKKFLGTDYWGRNAEIINDSVIRFDVKYYDDPNTPPQWYGKIKSFSVKTAAPLQIYMPKLGYILEYDLLIYSEKQKEEFISKSITMIGAYYFKEIEYSSANHKEQIKKNSPQAYYKRIQKNRLKAYYNSPMHLIRSLYTNTLKQNGYSLYKTVSNDTTEVLTNDLFIIDSCNCLSYSDNEAYLTGLSGEEFKIIYKSFKGRPFNPDSTINFLSAEAESTMQIFDNTCTLKKDGMLPELNRQIIFGGMIVKKRMGAALPYDIEF